MTDLSTALSRPATARRVSPLARFTKWVAVARSRRDLSRLDARSLADIGVSAHEAAEEAARPFWDAPQSWRK
ncbi:MAG: DUF1127 domain-containing protein [Pseudomonadota bacterium]